MNYFKEKKFATIAIIILVVLNITTITLLWMGRPSAHHHPPAPREKVMFDFITHELNFNPVQREAFEKQDETFRHDTRNIHLKIDSIQQQLFNSIYNEKSDKLYLDSLSNVIGSLEADINKMTYDHLVQIKSLCNDEQQIRYKALLNDLLKTLRPKPQDGPPPRREE